MKTNKHIELLRFYLVDRIDGIERAMERSLLDEVDDISSALISAIFSVYISSNTLSQSGFWAIGCEIVSLTAWWFVLKFLVIKPLLKLGRTAHELVSFRKKRLNYDETKKLVDQFDHIACDSILFSREYLEKYANLSNEGPEKEFYLIEAFYYYRKALDTTSGIVIEAESCIVYGKLEIQ